jgi:hypothetical protein
MKRLLSTLLFASAYGCAIAGYDVHITRKENWFDESGPCISSQDLQRLLKADRSVHLDKQNKGQNFLVNLKQESFPLWQSSDLCNLETKNPSPAALRKLGSIAKFLDARVQGDDGEIYGSMPFRVELDLSTHAA